MRKQLVLIIPILGAMIGMIAIVGLNSVNAQNMSTPETNMTGGTNETMDGNMTSGNATMSGATNMTSPWPLFLLSIINYKSYNMAELGKNEEPENQLRMKFRNMLNH